MASENAGRRPLSQRLETGYWLLLTILLGLPIITPLLRWSAVPCTHDGHLHYHRVAAMAHAWENGIYLTRWLPDLAFGYGYPFFVYREAAPLYAILLPFLAGLPLPAASNLFYAVTILLCGVFMFLWVRDLFGPRAGLVSVVAYMGAPYVLVDALIRGNSPESLALPLFPLILWAGRRWVLFDSARYFVVGALGLALLSFGHNISTFIFAPTLVVYLGALALGTQTTMTLSDDEDRSTGRRSSVVGHRLIRAALLIGLGLGLAFFYTGGAVLEMDQVTLEMSTTTRNNDWRYNFASLGEILSPVVAEDPALVNPPLLFRLGWVPLLLAAIGATGLAWIKGRDGHAHEQRLHIGLMIAGVVVYLFMALPVSRWLWEIVPLIDFVQFPWRFVGRAALPVAFLAGVPFYYFDRGRTRDDGPQTTDDRQRIPVVGGRWSAVILATAIALLIIETIPNLYPRMCYEEPFPTILTVHNYEHITGLVGVDPEGSYFPRTVEQRPTGSPLEADFIAGRTPQRFDATALPDGAQAQNIVYERFGVTLTVDSPAPFTARYLSFAFPGWSARVDGERVDIIPESPSGLITFDVPAGTHTIEVDWGATPLRLALVGLSILSAVGVLGVIVWSRRRPSAAATGQTQGATLKRNELALLILLGLGLLTFKVYVDRNETALRRAAAPPVSLASTLQGGEMALNGFNLSRDRVPAGETFDIDMAWTAVAPPQVDYQSEISLVGPDGLAWSQKGTERPRAFEDAAPTRLWTAGEWGWDSREVATLSGTPPGTYDIVVTLFDKATLAPVTLVDTSIGQAVGPTAVIGQIEIVNPSDAPTFDAQYPADHVLPDSALRLLGYNQDRAEAAPGESVLLTLFWECREAVDCEGFSLSLRDQAGIVAQTWALPAVRAGLPADAWPSHGRLRGQHMVQLPATLESGRYQFFLGDFPLGEIVVTAPERTFTQPELNQSINAAFITADGASITTLTGIALDPTFTTCAPVPWTVCSLPLVWHVTGESTIGYHVFVHLVDEAGNILAQSDAVPASWTRPTTGWLPGEYIVDVHTLSLPPELPPGQLTFRVGLYDPVTDERLSVNGTDAALIAMPGS